MRFLGYLDAAHNRRSFTQDGWYRTGDLARIEAGRLTVTGRLAEVVSRNGLTISLAEIDAVAAGLPCIEAAAFAVPDAATGERLALAMHVTDPDAVAFGDVVGLFRDAGLATWKLPEQIDVWVTPFPRTSTGKIHRRLVAERVHPVRTLLAPRVPADPAR
jgi:2,3-dihydroxybenzoate-AMP ligase